MLSFTLIQQTRLILFTYHNNAPRCFLFVYTALSTSSQRIAALTSRSKLSMGNRTRPILSHTLRPLHLNSSKCRKRQSKFVNASTQCLVFLPICQANSQVLNQSPPQEKCEIHILINVVWYSKLHYYSGWSTNMHTAGQFRVASAVPFSYVYM